MLVIVSQVQRVEIECVKHEYREARLKVEAEDYKIVAAGPKIEDGVIDPHVYVVTGEKVIVRKMLA